jgi:hypothetical protein
MLKTPHYFALAVVAALVLVGSAAAGPNAAHTKRAAAPPIRVDFVKHVVDPTNFVFEGTVSGGVTGALTSKLVSLDAQQGKILHVTFDWIVSAGGKSFTARTKGTWNQNTGQVVMNGSVIDGYQLGAPVHEQGKLVDPTTLTFQGYLRLMPKG